MATVTVHPVQHLGLPAGFTARPGSLADAPALYELYIAADLHDHKHWAGSLQATEDDFRSSACNPQTDTVLVFAPDGSLAAGGFIFVNPAATFERNAQLFASVHPRFRRLGIGRAVLRWLEQRGSAILRGYVEDKPHKLTAPAHQTPNGARELLESEGFRMARAYYRMRRDLAQPLPPVTLADGYRLLPWLPERQEEAHQVLNQAFLDHWGWEPIVQEPWEMYFLASDSFRPDLSYVVLDPADRMVGVSFNRVSKEDNARAGVQEGWIGTLGVLREARGRGLATALLAASMHAFKDDGLTTAGLSVDSENLTGALRLYEGVGFRVTETSYNYRREPLSQSGDQADGR